MRKLNIFALLAVSGFALATAGAPASAAPIAASSVGFTSDAGVVKVIGDGCGIRNRKCRGYGYGGPYFGSGYGYGYDGSYGRPSYGGPSLSFRIGPRYDGYYGYRRGWNRW